MGLTTTCALAHHGVDCLLGEPRRKPKQWSRANNLWARPQELLASVGVRDAIAEQAYRIHPGQPLLNGRTLIPSRSPMCRVLTDPCSTAGRT